MYVEDVCGGAACGREKIAHSLSKATEGIMSPLPRWGKMGGGETEGILRTVSAPSSTVGLHAMSSP